MAARILNSPDFKTPNFLTDLNQSVGEYLWKILQQSKNRECLVHAHTGERRTLDQIIQQSTNLAIQLQNLNCGPDTVIGIISENRHEYLVVVLATFFAGAILTCFNPLYTIGELENSLGISQPSILFCSSVDEKIEKLIKSTSTIQQIISFDHEEGTPATTLLFENFIKPTQAKLQVVHKDPESIAAILYSSGTTGFPKGVAITNKNIIYMLKLFRDENIFGIQKKSTIIEFAPMFHAYGLFVLLQSIVLEIRVVFLQKFEEIVFLQCIERYQVKILFTVPPIVMFLLKDSRVDDFDLSSIEKIICGAASLKYEIEKAIRKKLKLRTLSQAYGMTECTLACTLRHKRTGKMGSSGSALSGVQMKIVDPISNKMLPPNQSGEICIRGLGVTKGYYRNEKATADTFDQEGWLHSGDIGYYDEDGDIFIVDRLKELIKYNAYQISPAELESILMKHEKVNDAAVIGVPNDIVGEIPTAFVVKKPGSTISEKELVDYAAALVSPQKKLRGGVVFTEQIPKNPSGKILRRKLKEIYKTLISRY
ncbi:hypothetical protein V9T40_003656 [Parthenolecanium corni]|uniref:Uncharacterized protein n=1 Tax=Parthenolecanium corni TaxID=536013 RepID=A0AAN9TTW5_9HEMI